MDDYGLGPEWANYHRKARLIALGGGLLGLMLAGAVALAMGLP